MPYDRIGPNAEIVATRVASMARLAAAARKGPTVVLTTVNSILQRLPPREFIRRSLKTIAPGQRIDMNQLIQRLNLAGFQRTGTVMEAGEYAVRGGILDLFPPGRLAPVRLDFFGDTLEHIKAFDPETQRTGKIVQKLTLMPISEVAFGEEAEKRFRRNYLETFGPATSEDALYEAVSAGQRYPGMEHWLPLFHDHLETLFDYVPRRARQLRPPGRAGGGGAPGPDRRPLRGAGEGARDAHLRRAALQARAGGRHVPDEQGVGRAPGRPHRAPHDAVRGGLVIPAQRSEQHDAGRKGRWCVRQRDSRSARRSAARDPTARRAGCSRTAAGWGATSRSSAPARAATCSTPRPSTCAPCRPRASG